MVSVLERSKGAGIEGSGGLWASHPDKGRPIRMRATRVVDRFACFLVACAPTGTTALFLFLSIGGSPFAMGAVLPRAART